MEMEEEHLTGKERCKAFCTNHWKGYFLILIPLMGSPLLFMTPYVAFRCAYTIFIMAMFWITEAIPLPITSLIPMVTFPIFGIMGSEDVCKNYMKDSLVLFFGGLMVASAVEYCGLHKRIALNVMKIVGCTPRRLHFSLMLVTMLFSMWVANAAATAMMCPIVKAVVEELSQTNMIKATSDKPVTFPEDPPHPSKVVMAFYLGICYAATVGGCGTLIGTGTNIAFKGIYEAQFPDEPEITFLQWMFFNVPHSFILNILVYIWLEFWFMGLFRPKRPDSTDIVSTKEASDVALKMIINKKADLGPMSCHEVQVSILFALMIVAFITRKPGFITGWADVMNEKEMKSSFPVIVVVLFMFILPINYLSFKYCCCRKPTDDKRTASLMVWSFLNKETPWGLIILLGGGYCVAAGIKSSGFAKMVGESLSVIKSVPLPVTQLLVILVTLFCTCFTANTAMCNILAPILLEMGTAIDAPPMYLSFPSAIAVSMAFLLPVSTPPNAIAARYGNIRSIQMFYAGCGATVITIITLVFFCQTWSYVAFPQFNKLAENSTHDVTTVAP